MLKKHNIPPVSLPDTGGAIVADFDRNRPGGEGGGRPLEPPFEDWAQLGPGRLGWPGFGHAGLCWADTPRLGSTGPDWAAARLSLGCGLTPAYT